MESVMMYLAAFTLGQATVLIIQYFVVENACKSSKFVDPRDF